MRYLLLLEEGHYSAPFLFLFSSYFSSSLLLVDWYIFLGWKDIMSSWLRNRNYLGKSSCRVYQEKNSSGGWALLLWRWSFFLVTIAFVFYLTCKDSSQINYVRLSELSSIINLGFCNIDIGLEAYLFNYVNGSKKQLNLCFLLEIFILSITPNG